jgi:hypothetical protein
VCESERERERVDNVRCRGVDEVIDTVCTMPKGVELWRTLLRAIQTTFMYRWCSTI